MKFNINTVFVLIIFAMGCSGPRYLAENIEDTYYGYLPCADCPGIFYEIEINPDFTYIEKILYDGRTDQPLINEGKYRITRDSVIILRGKETEGMNRFAIKNGKLEMLSPLGEKIETGFPERYILTREKHERVFEEITGTGFRATGNEPFWGLQIEFYNKIEFNALSVEGFEFTTTLPDPERPGDMSLVKYSAEAGNGEFQVTINREECMDTMSGELFPFKVIVAARRDHRESFRRFEGCGEYLGPYRLNDIWKLEEINDIPVSIPQGREHPVLHIDLSGKKIYGYGGCNRFSGSVELVNNRVVTGAISSTKKACLDTQEIEDRFFSTISGKTLDFEIDNSILILGDGMTKLTFSRHKAFQDQ